MQGTSRPTKTGQNEFVLVQGQGDEEEEEEQGRKAEGRSNFFFF
jgi:hypothetical protein